MLPAGKNLAIMSSEDLLHIRLRDGKVMNSTPAGLGCTCRCEFDR